MSQLTDIHVWCADRDADRSRRVRDGTACPRPALGRTCNKGTMAAESDASGGIRAFERSLEIALTPNP
jgi:hypothetical protein